MRVLITHHGQLPSPGAPVTGGALRAWNHGRALQAAGHEVHWLTRAQDQPGGFASPAELALRARALRPDRIVCVQPEDAPALKAVGAPMAVDLYAPRLVEAAFEDNSGAAAVPTLRALGAGDVFLVSNPRQRWHWLGLLALAGLDVRTDPTLLVPLIAPEGPTAAPPDAPVLVAGGATWPWQDPLPALERVLTHLDRRGAGEVQWFGGAPLVGPDAGGWTLPEHPRLRAMGWLPYDQLLDRYASATAAIDWMAPNPERELALSFRHVDYLGCGLPVLTGPNSALAGQLGRAGIASDDIEGSIDKVLDDPGARDRMSAAARRLAGRTFSLKSAAPLLRWVASGTRHPRAPCALLDHADLAASAARATQRAEGLAAAEARAQAEVEDKRREAARLTAQVQDLIRTTERLARAIDEVAGFKREAIAVLGSQTEHGTRSLEEANRQLGLLRADISKKTAELRGMDDLRARLENDNQNLREEIARLRDRRGRFGR